MQILGTHDRAAWQRALAALPHGYWHTWEANSALEAGYGCPTFLYVDVDADGTPVAACPFSERTHAGFVDIFTPAAFAGFVATGDAAAVRARWQSAMAARGYVCGYFTLHPCVAAPEAHDGLRMRSILFHVDLAEGAEAAFARADRYVRRARRDWQAQERIVLEREPLHAFLVDHYNEFMERAGVHPRAILPRATVAAMFAEPDMLLVGVADDEGICAAHTFALTPHCAESHTVVHVRDGRRHNTGMICWGIEEVARRGIRWFNLGGGVHRGDAIEQAKLKFRPLALQMPVAREVYRPDAYAALCAAAGRDPQLGDGYFPAYRA